MSKVLSFKEYEVSESMQDYIDKYKIHTVRQMLANGMLTIDDKDYDSFPYYMRRYRWINSYVHDANDNTDKGKYETALADLRLAKHYIEEMTSALEIAIKDRDSQSGSKEDQSDPDIPTP